MSSQPAGRDFFLAWVGIVATLCATAIVVTLIARLCVAIWAY